MLISILKHLRQRKYLVIRADTACNSDYKHLLALILSYNQNLVFLLATLELYCR